IPGCNNRRNLEIDHTVPLSEGGRTCLENLNRQCPTHHWLKTNARWRLSGGPGAWMWGPPRVPATDWQPSPA
ncbi:MAG: HNH endonuclease signature motif containing protein, partial [Actinomycetota bacterium]